MKIEENVKEHCSTHSTSAFSFMARAIPLKPLISYIIGQQKVPTQPAATNMNLVYIEPPSPVAASHSEGVTEPRCFCERYTLEQLLGSGAFGKVYRCNDTTTNRSVAIKYLPKKCVDYRDLERDRVRGTVPMEVFALSRLKHPNIIQFIDYYEEDFFYVIVTDMPSPDIRDLFDFIEKCHSDLTDQRLRYIFRQILDAIDYMHEHGFAHLDIKDENILIDRNDHVYLIDFGATQRIPRCKSDYLTSLRGTPHAMSPEQWQSKPYRGVEQDIWGLGVLLYTLHRGYPPFNGSDVLDSSRLAKLLAPSNPLTDLISKMLEFDVDQRISINGIRSHMWMVADQPDIST